MTALALGSCQQYIDMMKIEMQVLTTVKNQTGLEAKTISCPPKVKFQVNATFQCDVALSDNQVLTADIIQQNKIGEIRVNLEDGIKALKGVIDNDLLARQITEGVFAQTQIRVNTDCGGRLRLTRKEDTFTCITTNLDNQEKNEVRVVVKDDEGRLSWEI